MGQGIEVAKRAYDPSTEISFSDTADRAGEKFQEKKIGTESTTPRFTEKLPVLTGGEKT